MMWSAVFDIAGAVFLLVGALLCLAAAIGLLRFPDVLTRTHAATKPQTLGLLCVMTGLALFFRNVHSLGQLILIAVMQLLTVPVASHLVGRAAHRTGRFRRDLTTPDELADDLTKAGFRRVSTDDVTHPAGEHDAEGREHSE